MNFYDFSYPLATGQSYDFSQLKGKVVLHCQHGLKMRFHPSIRWP